MTELDKLNRRLEFTFKWGIVVTGGSILFGLVAIAGIVNMIIALLLGEEDVFSLAFLCVLLASILCIGLKSLSDLSEYYVDKYQALIRDQKNKTTP